MGEAHLISPSCRNILLPDMSQLRTTKRKDGGILSALKFISDPFFLTISKSVSQKELRGTTLRDKERSGEEISSLLLEWSP